MRNAGLVLAAMVVACGSGGSSGDLARSTTPIEPVVRDSAGVTIYELPADALDRAPRVTMDTKAIGAIGSDDPDDDASKVLDLLFLSDNRPVGFDAADGALVVYDQDGAVQRRIGRHGQGPGEFSRVDLLATTSGDTIVVSDGGNGRISLVDPDSGVIRAFPARMFSGAAGLAAGSRLRDGRWAMLPVSYAIDRGAGTVRPRYPVLAVAESAGVDGPADTLALQPGIAAIVTDLGTVGGKHRTSVSIERFGEIPGAQPLVSGFALIPGEDYRMLLHGDDGKLRAIVQINRSRIAVTDSITAAGIRVDLERLATAGTELPADRRSQAEERLRAQPVADSLPPFGRSYTTGTLVWLADYPNPAAPDQGYTAFDRAGRVVGRLLLPRTTRVEAFGSDRMILRTEDDDGIVRFEVHRLHLPTTTP